MYVQNLCRLTGLNRHHRLVYERSPSGLVASLPSAKRPLWHTLARFPPPPHLGLVPIEAYYYLNSNDKYI